MSYNKNKEDERRVYRKEKIKNFDKFWDKKYNCDPEGMHEKEINYKKTVKNLVDNLLEINPKKKRKTIQFRSIKYKKMFSTNSMMNISPKAKALITKIEKNYNKIKNSILDITKINNLYLEPNARRTFNNLSSIKKKINLKKLDIKKEHILDNLKKDNRDIRNKTNYKKLKNINLNNTNEVENKNLNNFLYANSNYRKQLNFAFLNYNPKSHLRNLKLLIQTEPLIKKDVLTINKEIDEDIKWRCDKHHFKKKYEILKKKFQRYNSVETTPKLELLYKKKSLPDFNIKDIAKAMKIFTPIYSEKRIINIYNKLKKEEESKMLFQRDKLIEELKYMIKASSGINELIKEDNINKKIDLFRTNYDQNVLNEYYGMNKKNILEKDYFDEEKKNVINKLGNIYEFKISNILKDKEKERKLSRKIISDNNAINLKILEDKNDAINELDDKIKNNIK